MSVYADYYKKQDNQSQYQRDPDPEKKGRLTKQFDELFSTVTDYEDLNDRIAKTLANKAELLRTLGLPELPLHNDAVRTDGQSTGTRARY
ncbi:MAG: hypothetical protein GQ529_03060 [Methyloprofundus sp.]|nr:hypothetical protein [Methyloprofundus sp.]